MLDDVPFRLVSVRPVLFDERCWLSIEAERQPAIGSTTTRGESSFWLASVFNAGMTYGHSAIGHRSIPCCTRIVNGQNSPMGTHDEDRWLVRNVLPRSVVYSTDSSQNLFRSSRSVPSLVITQSIQLR
jgi:hypothetical protein